ALTVTVHVTGYAVLIVDGLASAAPFVIVVVVSALFTTCGCELRVPEFGLKLPSPGYVVVIVCGPTASELVESVATPDALSTPVPMVDAPSLNVTVPVGMPAPGEDAVTVAVNVTPWPNTDGLTLDMSAVCVFALFTTCGLPASDPLLPLKFVSPGYVVVIVWLPTESVVVESVATPEPLRLTLPICVAPSKNSTVPVGVPDPGTT